MLHNNPLASWLAGGGAFHYAEADRHPRDRSIPCQLGHDLWWRSLRDGSLYTTGWHSFRDSPMVLEWTRNGNRYAVVLCSRPNPRTGRTNDRAPAARVANCLTVYLPLQWSNTISSSSSSSNRRVNVTACYDRFRHSRTPAENQQDFCRRSSRAHRHRLCNSSGLSVPF